MSTAEEEAVAKKTGFLIGFLKVVLVLVFLGIILKSCSEDHEAKTAPETQYEKLPSVIEFTDFTLKPGEKVRIKTHIDGEPFMYCMNWDNAVSTENSVIYSTTHGINGFNGSDEDRYIRLYPKMNSEPIGASEENSRIFYITFENTGPDTVSGARLELHGYKEIPSSTTS
ncbi:MAG: hypothetical protein KBD10_02915, partial [Candidatus Pacebacteria bacterium]|nr:hypothetical protein [Candidatus Paceibacterota bacterium]